MKTYCFLKAIDTTGLAENRREVYWPKSLGGRDYYEPSLRQTFTSKRQMRRHLAQYGLRDAGQLVNPDKPIGGRAKTKPDPLAKARKAYIASCGGVEGLLERVRQRRGNFL